MLKDLQTFLGGMLTGISPSLNTRVVYRLKFGKPINLKDPKNINEKISWLKLHDYGNNPFVKKCADKYAVRDYIKQRGCGDNLVPLIASYLPEEKIDWEALPNKFMLKLNVGCGHNLHVADKRRLDIPATERLISRWVAAKDWYRYSEMQYRGVQKRVLIEQSLCGDDNVAPLDYKFYCFGGKPLYVMVCVGRDFGKPKFYFYDHDWTLQPFSPEAETDPHLEKPAGIDEAFEISAKLSAPFPFVRTDLYIIDGRVWFGELTFTSSGGMDDDLTPEGLIRLGDLIHIDGLESKQ